MYWFVKKKRRFVWMKMSVYIKSIQETNNVTVENHKPAVLLKFAMYKMLFWKCRCDSHSWNVMKDNVLMMSQ